MSEGAARIPPKDEPINTDVLERIPLTARAVLEIGCGAGALGAEYKRRNPNCVYVGIESDPTLAEAARERLDEVILADIDAVPLPSGERVFDCVVYDDGLEHFRNPWAVLRAHVGLLSPQGVVVLCVPNAEHWSMVARLLHGTWDYADNGLTDQRHLRWFTRRSAERALTEAGLQVSSCTPRVFDAAVAQDFVKALGPALPGMRLDAQTVLDRVTPLQYLFVAARALPAPLIVYSTMLKPVGGVSHVRVIEPMEAIASIPGVTARVVTGWASPPPAEVPRILILHRPALLGPEALTPIREALRQGFVVLCEFDDHPDYIPILQNADVQNFKAVHAVQTSTPALADFLRDQNPEIAVFPNGIRRLPEIRNHARERTTLFFGGLNRSEEWPPYIEVLNEVAATLGERLHFRIVGDQALFDALATQHKDFTPICDYASYQSLLGDSEISLMPLRENPFNLCKSDLKFIEAAAHRVTALATPIAYAASIDDGVTGVLFHDAAELRDRLLRLVTTPDLARGIGDAARAYVAKHRMNAYQVADRLAWYRDLWARKPELDRLLAARRPELFEKPPAPHHLRRFGFDASRL